MKKAAAGGAGMVAVVSGIGQTEEVEEDRELMTVVVDEAVGDQEQTKAVKEIVEAEEVEAVAEGGCTKYDIIYCAGLYTEYEPRF